MKSSKLQSTIFFIITCWFIIFFFLPSIMIVGMSFLKRDDTHFVKMILTLKNYTRLLFDPFYFYILLHSLNIALIVTCICLFFGYPFAWILTKFSNKVRQVLFFLLMIPFWTNSLIRIYALKNFFSNRGYLNKILLWSGIIDVPIHIVFTSSAVVIGLVHILFPFMVTPIYSSIERLDKLFLETARDFGASKIQIFIRIVIPLTTPGIISGCLLVFLSSMGLFYVSDFMGGAKHLLIGNIIKSQFLSIRDWPFGSAISIVLTLIIGIMLLIYWKTSSFFRKRF